MSVSAPTNTSSGSIASSCRVRNVDPSWSADALDAGYHVESSVPSTSRGATAYTRKPRTSTRLRASPTGVTRARRPRRVPYFDDDDEDVVFLCLFEEDAEVGLPGASSALSGVLGSFVSFSGTAGTFGADVDASASPGDVRGSASGSRSTSDVATRRESIRRPNAETPSPSCVFGMSVNLTCTAPTLTRRRSRIVGTRAPR